MNTATSTPSARKGLRIGAAVDALRRGLKVQRAGWNGAGQFVYLVPSGAYPAQTAAAASHFGPGNLVPYAEYLAIKTGDEIVHTWAPSCSDTLASDWQIVD